MARLKHNRIIALVAFIILINTLSVNALEVNNESVDAGLLKALDIVDSELFLKEKVTTQDFSLYIHNLTAEVYKPEYKQNSNITVKEAVKELVDILGYESLSVVQGSVYNTAYKIGLLKDITYSDADLTPSVMCKLFNNTLNAYINKFVGINGDNVVYANKQVKFMEYFHNIYKSSGRIIAVNHHSVYSGVSVPKGYVLIDKSSEEELLSTKLNLTYEDLGLKGNFYYRDQDNDGSDKDLVYFDRSKDEVIKINSKDILEISGSLTQGFQIKYDDNGKEKKTTLAGNADYIYNTIADSDIDGLEITIQTLLSIKGEIILRGYSDEFTTVFLNHYINFVVDTISPNYYTIKDKNNIYNLSMDAKKDVIYIEKDGEAISFGNISSGDVLNVLYIKSNHNQDYYHITVSSLKNIMEIFEVDDVSISSLSEKIKKSQEFIEYEKSSGKTIVEVGKTYLVYLNVFGELVAVDTNAENIYRYGYMTKAAVAKSQLEDYAELRVFEQNSQWKNYKLFHKVKTNTKTVIAKDLFQNASFGFINSEGTTVNQLIKYRINYRGEITEIYRAALGDENFKLGKTISKSASVSSFTGLLDLANRDNRIYYGSNSIVFAVPDPSLSSGSNYESNFRIYSHTFFNEKELMVTGYDADDFHISKVLLTYATTSTTPNPGGNMVAVTKVTKAIDIKQDVEAVRIYYSKKSGEGYLEINEQSKCFDVAKTIEKGDVIHFSATGAEVDGIRKLVSSTEDLSKKAPIVDATAFNSDFALIFGKVINVDVNRKLVMLGSESNPFIFALNVSDNIIMYDKAVNKAFGIDIKNIQPNDYLFIRYEWRNSKEIILIREDY